MNKGWMSIVDLVPAVSNKANGGVFQCDGRFVATLKASW